MKMETDVYNTNEMYSEGVDVKDKTPSLDQRMELMLRDSIGSKNPGEVVRELLSDEGVERLKRQIVIPEVFFSEKPCDENMSRTLDGNFFNSMHKIAAQQVILAGKFSELVRVGESPAYGIYVKARDKLKGFFGFDVEKYDEQRILDRQLINLETCNNSIGALVLYSRQELDALRNKGIYRLLEMGGIHKSIDKQGTQVEHQRQILNEAKKYIPEKPWGESDMIRIALAKKLGYNYEDSIDKLKIYKDVLREIARDEKFVNVVETIFRSSVRQLENLLMKGLSTARTIRDIKPSLEVMKNQGLVGKVQEKQIIDIGNSSLRMYDQSRLSYSEIYKMMHNPSIENFRNCISGSLGEYITQGKGIDLGNLDYFSRL